jgi:1,4-dihydroxy-6-naphthoate synthase
MKRIFDKKLSLLMEEKIRESIQYAQIHPEEPRAYIRTYAQEMDDLVIHQHIDLYVNEYSLDIGPEGEKAVRFLFSEAEKKALIPNSTCDIF